MSSATDLSAHVLRARRTAAGARGAIGVAAIVIVTGWPGMSARPALATAGFSVILLTALVQGLAPQLSLLAIEESLAGSAGLLIVGVGDQRVTVLSVLWLSAVASGVLARGGRVHWIGRAVVLGALVLPVLRMGRLDPQHAGLIVAVIWLLLTCGRVTAELRHLLEQARHDADHDGLAAPSARSAFRTRLDGRLTAGDAISLLLVDLDGFGQINKANGDAAGDRVLVCGGRAAAGRGGRERIGRARRRRRVRRRAARRRRAQHRRRDRCRARARRRLRGPGRLESACPPRHATARTPTRCYAPATSRCASPSGTAPTP